MIDPGTREVEVRALALDGTGAWLMTDQTRHDSLWLARIDCRLSMDLVFKGVQGGST